MDSIKMRLELHVSPEEEPALDQLKNWGWLVIPEDVEVTTKPNGSTVITVVDTTKPKKANGFPTQSLATFKRAAEESLNRERDARSTCSP